jgi:glycosyltransferase involved in cell wall biosynthesis
VRIAWFSPLPPERSGIAAYTAEVLPLLAAEHAIDVFVERDAHRFVWRHRLQPYDLVVYQLGNARCHDYMWAYLLRYPGLAVLHDARLHQARARQLLQAERFDDYRAEFRFDHPEAVQDFTEYAVEGLGGPIYYFWSMLRPIMATARTVAVHNTRVADGLREQFFHACVDTIRMGVPAIDSSSREAVAARAALRRSLGIPDDAMVFAAFGKVTAEKRVSAIVRALAALRAEGRNVYGMFVGDDSDASLAADVARFGIADRVRVTGYVADEAVGTYLAAADVCVCLRWPTALETSASWLRCLAAARPTIISDLAHLVDVPSPVARRVDLLDEDRTLLDAMRELAADPVRRAAVAEAGHAYWAAGHQLSMMADDYRRLLRATAARPAPERPALPAHLTADYSERAKAIAREFGVEVDVL